MTILRKIIGFLLIASVMGGLVIKTCIDFGTKEALLAWGIALVIAAIIVGGVYLVCD